jgi:hypothetical protein
LIERKTNVDIKANKQIKNAVSVRAKENTNNMTLKIVINRNALG